MPGPEGIALHAHRGRQHYWALVHCAATHGSAGREALGSPNISHWNRALMHSSNTLQEAGRGGLG